MARTFVPLNILTDAYTDGDTTYPAGTGGVVMSSGSGAPDPSKELSTYSWSELSAITGSADITKDQLSHFVGQTKTTTVSGFSGNWSVRCIGVDQDSADGRAHVLTFEFVDILFLDKIGYTSIWPEGTAFSTLNGNVYNGLPHDLMTAVQSVEKDYFDAKKTTLSLPASCGCTRNTSSHHTSTGPFTAGKATASKGTTVLPPYGSPGRITIQLSAAAALVQVHMTWS